MHNWMALSGLFLWACSLCGQGVINGTVRAGDNPAPFAALYLPELDLGTTTDSSGYFRLESLPSGTYRVEAKYLGFLPETQKVYIHGDEEIRVNFELRQNPFTLDQVVVTGTRTGRRQLDNAVAVNVLDQATFSGTQSNTLSEGLCFQPGLRVETDCQTCGYTQLRMNGMGGSYAQVLIDSRPVFTSIMSLYSLEQIPANLIERVEVVRGGGSVLYGSNAIAGTVNVITRRPSRPSFALSGNTALVGGEALDYQLNGNANLVAENNRSGLSLFVSHRNRDAWDANGDDYSELPRIHNNSFGFKAFMQPSKGHELLINGWSLNELRRGGNKLDLPADQADQSEERNQYILAGGLEYNWTPEGSNHGLSVYAAGQRTRRIHYTGIDQSNGWGRTRSHTLTAGGQYNLDLDIGSTRNRLTAGLDYQHEYTFDEIEAYGYLIDQSIDQWGVFLQSDWALSNAFTLLSGLRLQEHSRLDKPAWVPRLSLLYKPADHWQVRASWARGFKAPQAFEADMHIAFAGGGVSLIRIDSNLQAEVSGSYNVSVDFNKPLERMIYGFTLNGFYTTLLNAFILEEQGTDLNGNQILLRRNGPGSSVRGVTVEGRFNYDQKVQLEMGLTAQQSRYDRPVAWSADIPGTASYLRTPDVYGFYTLSCWPEGSFRMTFSGVLTGPMLVPHFAGAPGVEQDELVKSPAFFEQHLKLAYRFELKGIGQKLVVSAGVQNIFNAYQDDFDRGRYRDSNYIYGPARPRTYFLGLTFGDDGK